MPAEYIQSRFIYCVMTEDNVAYVKKDLQLAADSDVIFIVNGASQDGCIAVCQAIADVHNIWMTGNMAQSCASVGSWVRTYGDWRGTPGSAGLGYDYVYAYATPEKHETSNENNDHLLVPKRVVDRVFYIGRGKNSRWIEHFKDFNQTVAMDAYFSDRGRLNQTDRGRRFSAIVDAQGCAQVRL